LGESEFGRGLVVCLVKFAEHFNNDMAKQITDIELYLSKNEDDRKLMRSFKPPSNLNYGKRLHDNIRFLIDKMVPIHGSIEKTHSRNIELWANGASDHLYEMMVPQRWKGTEIEAKVKELTDLGLKIGHGFTESIWTGEHYRKLWELTKDIAILIDQNIGLKRQVDWGEF
jgi:hypothetical protein